MDTASNITGEEYRRLSLLPPLLSSPVDDLLGSFVFDIVRFTEPAMAEEAIEKWGGGLIEFRISTGVEIFLFFFSFSELANDVIIKILLILSLLFSGELFIGVFTFFSFPVCEKRSGRLCWTPSIRCRVSTT